MTDAHTQLREILAELAHAPPAVLSDGARRCVATAVSLSHADAGGLYLLEEGSFVLVAHEGFSADFTRHRIEAQAELGGHLLAGRPLFLDAGQWLIPELEPERFQAIALIPALYNGAVLGCLALGSRAKAAWGMDEVTALTLLGAQIGTNLAHQVGHARLHEVHGNLRAFFAAAADYLFVLDENEHFLEIGDAFAEVLGRTSAALRGQPVSSLHPDATPDAQAALWQELLRGDWTTCPFPLTSRDGTSLQLETRLTPGQWDGRPAYIGIARDIGPRLAAEAGLRENEARYRAMFEHPGVIQILLDPEDGRIVDANRRAQEFYGASRAVLTSKYIFEINTLDRPTVERELAAVKARESAFLRFTHRTARGLRKVEVHAGPVQVGAKTLLFSVIHDVTEREEARAREEALERQLAEARRGEALGVLAGGIAHEFNNRLSVILGNTSLLLDDSRRESLCVPVLREIQQATLEAAGLVRHLLAYAGAGNLFAAPVSLVSLIQGVCRNTAKIGPCALDLPSESATVHGDLAQLRALIEALWKNAVESGGAVRVQLAALPQDAAALTPFFTLLRPGRYWVITVEDSGCGMSASTLERAFDPFFSTKAMGRGLGLPAALGIARAHGGGLHLRSTPGAGTRATLALPVHPR